jgi:glutamyl-Q tRNA(Asp) synthetase
MEDVDTPRCSPEAAYLILGQLAACGLRSDVPVAWQSKHSSIYQTSLDRLTRAGAVYVCQCSRADIARSLATRGISAERHRDVAYPGTCKNLKLQLQTGMSVRFSVPDIALTWPDRLLGKQQQQVATEVGDFVLKRSDGLWAYQLAVVVADAAQGITHVVRGEDLADNTPRQILLQQALGLPALIYMHTPLVLGENAEKLSKQNGAQAIDTTSAEKALQALQAAAAALGLQTPAQENCAQTLAVWVNEWRARLS